LEADQAVDVYIPRLVSPYASFIVYTLSAFTIREHAMFHLVFSIASGFLYLGNILQGFTRGILALRSLHIISHLVPTLSPPSPVKLLEAPAAYLDISDELRMPYPTTDLVVIEPLPSVMLSPVPSYQSSLVVVTPGDLPNLVPLFVLLAIISGLVCVLPELAFTFTTISKTISAFARVFIKNFRSFESKPTSNLVPAGPSSRLISFQSLITLVSFILLWTGPVRS
jgi:hypothetical protein